jgi:hypothetical protein
LRPVADLGREGDDLEGAVFPAVIPAERMPLREAALLEENQLLEAPEEIVVVAKGPGASLAGECPAAVSTAWVDTNCCLA